PDLIGRELGRIAKHINLLIDSPESEDKVDDHLQKIFGILKNASHVDFSFYKPGTVRRRVGRRMFLRKIESLDEYLRFIRANNEEVEALFNDILINVTGFFRDPEAFEALKTTALPA